MLKVPQVTKFLKHPANSQKIEAGIVLFIALFSLGALAFLIICSIPAFPSISDLPEYYAPARLVLKGEGAAAYNLAQLGAEEHLLFPNMKDRTVALFIPPPGLALLCPVGVLPPAVAPGVWKAFLTVCLFAIIFLCARFYCLPFKQICYLSAAVFLSQPAYESLRIDQLAPIFVLAYIAAIFQLSQGKDKSAGILLAVMILKPQQIVPFMFFLAGLGRWQTIKWFAVAILILSLLSLLFLGPAGYLNYLALIQSPESLSHMQPELTPTLRGQLLRLEYVFPIIGQSKAIISAITLAVYAMAIGFSFWLGGKAQKMERPIEVGVLASLPLTVVTSFHCHSYDLLLLTPTLLILFADRIFVTNQFLKLGIMLCGSIFMMPLCIYLHYDYLLKGGVVNPWFLELVLFASLIVILLLRHMKMVNAENSPAIT